MNREDWRFLTWMFALLFVVLMLFVLTGHAEARIWTGTCPAGERACWSGRSDAGNTYEGFCSGSNGAWDCPDNHGAISPDGTPYVQTGWQGCKPYGGTTNQGNGGGGSTGGGGSGGYNGGSGTGRVVDRCVAHSGYPHWALENPPAAGKVSGVSLISGWACRARTVTVRTWPRHEESKSRYMATAYGTERLDTAEECGDVDNGFGLLLNWNLLGPGIHALELSINRQVKTCHYFTVTTLGEEFVRRASDEVYTLENFPSRGETANVQWQQSQQNFVIVED